MPLQLSMLTGLLVVRGLPRMRTNSSPRSNVCLPKICRTFVDGGGGNSGGRRHSPNGNPLRSSLVEKLQRHFGDPLGQLGISCLWHFPSSDEPQDCKTCQFTRSDHSGYRCAPIALTLLVF